jgi:hypothetical protein
MWMCCVCGLRHEMCGCGCAVQHNFYVQLKGSKRFLLWPPEQIEAMYLYPFLHPAHQV